MTQNYNIFVVVLLALNLLHILPTTTALSPTSTTTPIEGIVPSTAQTKTRDCVIVGGGPVGLAAAITLSRAPHCYEVTVLEKTEGSTAVTKYDPSRSFLYNVNSRGLQWFQQEHPAILHRLQERGTDSGLTGFNIIPADPKDRKSVV